MWLLSCWCGAKGSFRQNEIQCCYNSWLAHSLPTPIVLSSWHCMLTSSGILLIALSVLTLAELNTQPSYTWCELLFKISWFIFHPIYRTTMIILNLVKIILIPIRLFHRQIQTHQQQRDECLVTLVFVCLALSIIQLFMSFPGYNWHLMSHTSSSCTCSAYFYGDVCRIVTVVQLFTFCIIWFVLYVCVSVVHTVPCILVDENIKLLKRLKFDFLVHFDTPVQKI